MHICKKYLWKTKTCGVNESFSKNGRPCSIPMPSESIWQAILRAKLGNTLEGAVLLSQMGSILYQMALYSQVMGLKKFVH